VSVYIPVELQRQIRNLFINCCAYCRTAEVLIATTFEIEHIVPRSAGGQSVFENLCLACPSCNRYKANRQKVIDPLRGEEVLLFHPQDQSWNEHFAWDENATEIIGITAIGRATIFALKMNRSQLVAVRQIWVQVGEHPPSIT
jgi:hypothetical protein